MPYLQLLSNLKSGSDAQRAWANIPPRQKQKEALSISPYLYRARDLVGRSFNNIRPGISKTAATSLWSATSPSIWLDPPSYGPTTARLRDNHGSWPVYRVKSTKSGGAETSAFSALKPRRGRKEYSTDTDSSNAMQRRFRPSCYRQMKQVSRHPNHLYLSAATQS
jgi:hypothetical protein